MIQNFKLFGSIFTSYFLFAVEMKWYSFLGAFVIAVGVACYSLYGKEIPKEEKKEEMEVEIALENGMKNDANAPMKLQ